LSGAPDELAATLRAYASPGAAHTKIGLVPALEALERG